MSQYYIVYDMNNQPYFAHSGVKGMKWGSFRWWTPDKKLTPAGREHYGIGGPRTNSSDGGAQKHKGEIVSTSGVLMRDKTGTYTKDALKVVKANPSIIEIASPERDKADDNINDAFREGNKRKYEKAWKAYQKAYENDIYMKSMRYITKGNNIEKVKEAFPGQDYDQLEETVHQIAKQEAARRTRDERDDWEAEGGLKPSYDLTKHFNDLQAEYKEYLSTPVKDPVLLEEMRVELAEVQKEIDSYK